MSDTIMNRGRKWFEALAESNGSVPGNPGSLLLSGGKLGDEEVVFVGLAPDQKSRFPRAGHTEVGVDEGWFGTKALHQVIEADKDKKVKRPIITVCDTKSQAYGRREELFGIHVAAAAIIAAYADARTAGHPVIALIVGRCVSGAFLALAGQANRMIAFNDPEVLVHAMYKEAAARITRRSVEELDRLGKEIVPMAYDIGSFAKLGGLHALLDVPYPDEPTSATVAQVQSALIGAIADTRGKPTNLDVRLESDGAKTYRKASLLVRQKMAEQWN